MQVDLPTGMSANARSPYAARIRHRGTAEAGPTRHALSFPMSKRSRTYVSLHASKASATSVTPISNHPSGYGSTLPDRTCTASFAQKELRLCKRIPIRRLKTAC
jgi:hypothetical protein